MTGSRVLALASVVAIAGCFPKSPDVSDRARARAAILTVAEAVNLVDGLCAQLALLRNDEKIGDTCHVAYSNARIALFAAEDMLDRAGISAATCETQNAVAAMSQLAAAVRAGGGTIPPVVDDALSIATSLSRIAPCGGKT